MSTRFITFTHLYIVTRARAITEKALVVTDTRHRISRSGLLGPRLALQPDAHVVGVPLLAPVAEAGVELSHGVRAVEGHLVA